MNSTPEADEYPAPNDLSWLHRRMSWKKVATALALVTLFWTCVVAILVILTFRTHELDGYVVDKHRHIDLYRREFDGTIEFAPELDSTDSIESFGGLDEATFYSIKTGDRCTIEVSGLGILRRRTIETIRCQPE